MHKKRFFANTSPVRCSGATEFDECKHISMDIYIYIYRYKYMNLIAIPTIKLLYISVIVFIYTLLKKNVCLKSLLYGIYHASSLVKQYTLMLIFVENSPSTFYKDDITLLEFVKNHNRHVLQSLLTHWSRVTHWCVGKLSLVQIMACRLDGAKPLSEPMLEYC